MADKTRYTANLVSDSNLYIDIVNDRVGIGTTIPTSKLSVDGNVYVSGIITSSSGALISGVGIATAGGVVGTGVTLLDFRGAGISTVTVSSGIGTINIEGGGGSVTPDISSVMMSMIF